MHPKKNRPGCGKSNHQIKLDSLDLIILSQHIKLLLFFQMEDNEVNLNLS